MRSEVRREAECDIGHEHEVEQAAHHVAATRKAARVEAAHGAREILADTAHAQRDAQRLRPGQTAVEDLAERVGPRCERIEATEASARASAQGPA